MPKLSGANVRFIEKHVLLSVNICANNPPYEEAKCFVSTGNENTHVQAMVTNMLAYMNEISDYIYNLLLQSFQSLAAKIDEDIARENKTDESNHPLTKVKADLGKWARLLPVTGYNSGF